MSLKSKPGFIQVFEYETLVIGDEHFTPGHLNALEIYHEKNGNRYFDLVRNGVRFKEYVGALKVGSIHIEVLPKADKSSQDKKVWQDVLIGMLRKVHGFQAHVTSNSSLKLHPNAVFELYYEMFVKEVELLVHQGLVKRYRKVEGNQNALKGSLQFRQHVQKNLTHQERFFVRYTTYDRNNPYNCVLRKTLCLLQKINIRPVLQSRINNLLLNFPELPDIQVDEVFVEKLVINRKTEGYRKALGISKLILLNYHPDLSKGRNDVLALMFDMNRLWERYVFASLRRAGLSYEIQVSKQASRGFWKGGTRAKTIRPDMVIESGEGTIILDTKWKMHVKGEPSDSDLKQIFTYNHYWKANKGFLVYPGKEDPLSGNFYDLETRSLPISKDKFIAGQIWVSVLDKENNVDKKLGVNILKTLDLVRHEPNNEK